MSGHRDDVGARMGMWLFLVTEITLFGGLFIAYSYLRHQYPAEFHHAGGTLNLPCGVINTLVLLTSSLTTALSLQALQEDRPPRAMAFLACTLGLGLTFLAIKGLEWSAKIRHGLYPSAPHLAGLPPGEQVFYSLYFTMTGLHGVHVLAGLSVFAVLLRMLARREVRADRTMPLENGGLFWHLVDVIWIFLLPAFYLAA
jgi:cytochrome c oxidase subunit 3